MQNENSNTNPRKRRKLDPSEYNKRIITLIGVDEDDIYHDYDDIYKMFNTKQPTFNVSSSLIHSDLNVNSADKENIVSDDVSLYTIKIDDHSKKFINQCEKADIRDGHLLIESFARFVEYIYKDNLDIHIVKTMYFWKDNILTLTNSKLLYLLLCKFAIPIPKKDFIDRFYIRATNGVVQDPKKIKSLPSRRLTQLQFKPSGTILLQNLCMYMIDNLTSSQKAKMVTSVQQLFTSIQKLRRFVFTYSNDARFMQCVNSSLINLMGYERFLSFYPTKFGTEHLPQSVNKGDLTAYLKDQLDNKNVKWYPLDFARPDALRTSAHKNETENLHGRTKLVKIEFDKIRRDVTKLPEFCRLLLQSGSRPSDLINNSVYLPCIGTYDAYANIDDDKKITVIGASKNLSSRVIRRELLQLQAYIFDNLNKLYEIDFLDDVKERVEDLLQQYPSLTYIESKPVFFTNSTRFLENLKNVREMNMSEDELSVQDSDLLFKNDNDILKTTSYFDVSFQFSLYDMRHIYACIIFFKMGIDKGYNPLVLVSDTLGHQKKSNLTPAINYLYFLIK